jgi:hypothetical protein
MMEASMSGNEGKSGASVDPAGAASGGAAAPYPPGDPQCVYLYHVTASPDGDEPYIEAFIHNHDKAIGAGDIEPLIVELAQKAAGKEIQPYGWAIGDLRWHRISYIAMVMHDPKRVFRDEKAFLIADKYQAFDENTFFTFKIGADDVQAIYCRNDIKYKNGQPSGGVESFRLYLYPDPNYRHRLHEDTGQNMGPPVPPP